MEVILPFIMDWHIRFPRVPCNPLSLQLSGNIVFLYFA